MNEAPSIYLSVCSFSSFSSISASLILSFLPKCLASLPLIRYLRFCTFPYSGFALRTHVVLYHNIREGEYCVRERESGMRIRIRSDPLIFGPPDPDPLLFSLDPDPTCNNGFIDLFSKNKPESTNSSLV